MLSRFSCQIYLLAQVTCQCHIGSGVMTIFVGNGLTKNPEIGNNLEFQPNICSLAWVRNTKFGNLQNSRMSAFTISESLRENKHGG